MLYRKLIRDTRRQGAQVAAIVLVVFLGTALFIGPYLAYEDLRDSYRNVQIRTHLAELTLDVTSVSTSQVQKIAGLDGVQAAESQVIVDLPVNVPTGRDVAGNATTVRTTARLISIPPGRQPMLNQAVVLSGHYPAGPTEVLVERHYAEYHHLAPGDAVEVETPAGRQRFAIAGVAVSAEYLWVTRSRQDVFPSPAQFGVLFVPRDGLASLGLGVLGIAAGTATGPSSPELPTLELAASGDRGNRLLLALKPGADGGVVTDEVTKTLGAQDVLAATARAKLPGIQLLQLDVDGFQETAVAFPIFFLAVGAFMIASLLNRQIDQERPIIGTMLAIGLKPKSILKHYAAFGLLVGMAGALLGAVVGLLLGGTMAAEYAAELYIPFVTTHIDWLVVGVGAAIGLVIPLVSAAVPARRAAALQPAEAMRALLPQRPVRGIGRARLDGIALWLRLPLRDIARHPWRSVGTAGGVAAAVVLIVATAGMFDSMARGLSLAFDQSQRYDLRVDFYVPRPTDRIEGTVRSVSGVEATEVLLALPVQVSSPASGRTYETVLQGLPRPSPLLRVLDGQGGMLVPAENGAVVSRSIADQIKVRVGDDLRITFPPAGPSTTVKVDALSDSLLGNAVVLSAARAEAASGLTGQATTALLTVAPGRRAEVRSRLENLDGVAQVSDLTLLRGQIDGLLGLLNVFLAMMVFFGVVLAAAILFNTATMSIIERRRELATIRAMGERMSGIVRLVTVENSVIAALGLLAGLPLALVSLWLFLRLFSSDLFSMPFWVSPRTLLLAMIGTLLVLLIAQWPALRGLSRTDLAEAVKSRE